MLASVITANRGDSAATGNNKLVSVADAVVAFRLHQVQHPKVKPIDNINNAFEKLDQ